MHINNDDQNNKYKAIESCHADRGGSQKLQILAEYIDQLFFNIENSDHGLSSERKCWHNVRFAAKMMALATLGLSAGISYGQVSFSIGQEHPPLGYIAGASTTISYGLATTWVVNEFINNFYPLEKEVLKLFEARNNNFKLVRVIACVFLGMLTCVSEIYIMEQYSSSLALSVIAVVIDFCYKALGYFELFEFVEARYNALNFHNNERNLLFDAASSKLGFASDIKEFIIPHLIENPNMYDELFARPESSSAKDRSSILVQRLLSRCDELKRLTIRSANFERCKLLVKFLVVIPALGDFTLNYYLSSQIAKSFVSPWLQVIFGFLAATPLLCLDMLGYTRTVDDISLDVYSAYTGKTSLSFTSKFYGSTVSALIRTSCFILAIFSAYIDWVITSEQLGNSDDGFMRTISPMVAIGVFASSTVFEGFASTQIINDIYLNSSMSSNDPDKRDTSNAIQKLGFFADFVGQLKNDLFEQQIESFERISRSQSL